MNRRAAWIAAALLALAGAVAAERIVVEAIVVRVNDRVMTISDFRQRLEQELSQRPDPPVGDQLATFAKDLLNAVVDEMVLLERAVEKSLTADEADLDRAIQQLREDNNLQDDEAFKEALISAGMTLEELRERYRQSIVLNRAVQGDVRPSEITQEELRQRYEAAKEEFRVPARVELEQVFLPFADTGADREAVLGRAKGMVERARRGADLTAEATLAGVELQALGAIPLDDLRPDLRAALESLDESGITDPLETVGGFQILRLIRRIPSGYTPFAEVEEQLRRRESQRVYQEQTRGLVDRLRKEYLVEVHEELIELVLDGLAHD